MGYARFKGSKEWKGRSRMVGWLITLNGMKASEEVEHNMPTCPIANKRSLSFNGGTWNRYVLLFDAIVGHPERAPKKELKSISTSQRGAGETRITHMDLHMTVCQLSCLCRSARPHSSSDLIPATETIAIHRQC
ncbi:hypothetical protein BKA82DRAFT_2007182 [Pisolithus tinctorius]|nr:hypothetical protein BKA82DRAFT_2007182 [Pisolithus tinctorius]